LNLFTFRSALRASKTDSWLGRAGLQISGRAGFGRRRIIIARSLLRVKQFDLANGIAAADRLASLRAQALAWQPFDVTGLRFGLIGTRGICFGWDASAAASAVSSAGLVPDEVDWMPESALLAPQGDEPCRLLRGREGYEGQCWQQGMLLASRWWPLEPTEVEWSDFSRLNPVASGVARPAPVEVGESSRPWIDLRGPDQAQDSVARLERLAVFGGGLLLVAATAPVLHEAWLLHSSVQQAEQQLDELSASASSVARIRTEALKANAATNELVAELRSLSPLIVMKELSEVLPKEGVLLKEMDLEGDSLKLTMELAPGLSRSALVERLQSTNVFGGIAEQRAQAQANWVSYTMRVNTAMLTMPAPASAPASTAIRKEGGA
jgi:hypothetical protein